MFEIVESENTTPFLPSHYDWPSGTLYIKTGVFSFGRTLYNISLKDAEAFIEATKKVYDKVYAVYTPAHLEVRL